MNWDIGGKCYSSSCGRSKHELKMTNLHTRNHLPSKATLHKFSPRFKAMQSLMSLAVQFLLIEESTNWRKVVATTKSVAEYLREFQLMARNTKKIVSLSCFTYNKLLKGSFNESFSKVLANTDICLMTSMYRFTTHARALIKGLKSLSFCFPWLVCLDK